jgi:hypothetical protein
MRNRHRERRLQKRMARAREKQKGAEYEHLNTFDGQKSFVPE